MTDPLEAQRFQQTAQGVTGSRRPSARGQLICQRNYVYIGQIVLVEMTSTALHWALNNPQN